MATSATRPSRTSSSGEKRTHSGDHSHSRPSSASKSTSSRLVENGLSVPINYINHLPQQPRPPKFLPYLFMPNRFVNYQPTSLEKVGNAKLLVARDVGVEVDLVDDSVYVRKDDANEMHPADEALLKDEAAVNKRAQLAGMHHTWLLKPRYIETKNKRFGKGLHVGGENKVYGRILSEEDSVVQDKDQQIKSILDTFKTASSKCAGIVHPMNPNLTVESVQPLLPDYKHWGLQFAQGTFDNDPSSGRTDISPSEEREFVAQSVLTDNAATSDSVMLRYYLPTTSTFQTRKRRRAGEEEAVQAGEQYTFTKVRDYVIDIKQMEGEEIYCFGSHQDTMTYVPIQTAIKFNRKRIRKQEKPDYGVHKLVVEHLHEDPTKHADVQDSKSVIFVLESDHARGDDDNTTTEKTENNEENENNDENTADNNDDNNDDNNNNDDANTMSDAQSNENDDDNNNNDDDNDNIDDENDDNDDNTNGNDDDTTTAQDDTGTPTNNMSEGEEEAS